MKKWIFRTTAALLMAGIATVSAGAEYHINAEQDGNIVKAEVTAENATLPAMEFMLTIPEDAEINVFFAADGALFNADSGIFAWVGTEPPADGTVMLSVEFTIPEDFEGTLSVIPSESFEADIPVNLTLQLPVQDSSDGEDNNSPDEESSGEEGNPDDAAGIPNEDGEGDDASASEPDNDSVNGDEEPSDGQGTSDDEDANKPSEDSNVPESEPSDDTSDTNSDISGGTADDANPDTGVTMSAAAAAAAGAAFVAAFKRKKQK